MKQIALIGIVLMTFFGCGETPTQFSEAVLTDSLINLNDEKVEFKDVLAKHKGKQFVINVWASWCRDCIVGMPNLKALQDEFKDVEFVFLSVDRNEAAWKRSLEKIS